MDIYKNAQIHFPNVFLMFFQQGFYGDQVPILTVLSFFIFDHRKVGDWHPFTCFSKCTLPNLDAMSTNSKAIASFAFWFRSS